MILNTIDMKVNKWHALQKQPNEKANVRDKIPCNIKVERSVTEKYTWKTPRLNQEA